MKNYHVFPKTNDVVTELRMTLLENVKVNLLPD